MVSYGCDFGKGGALVATRHEKRINISLSEDMLKRLDYYASLFGIPRASMCSMLIGQGIVAWDKSISITDSMVQQINASLSGDITKRLRGQIEKSGADGGET